MEDKSTKLKEKYFNSDVDVLKNKIYKILPMYENKVPTLQKYTDSLVDELCGFRDMHESLHDNKIYSSILSIISFLSKETYSYAKCRSHVLSCVNALDKIKTGDD